MVLLNTNKIVLLLRTCFFLSFCHLMSNQYIPFVIYNALISTLYTPLFVPNISGFQSVSISLHQCPALNAMNPNKNITVRILCRYSQNTFHCKIFKQLLEILVSAPATDSSVGSPEESDATGQTAGMHVSLDAGSMRKSEVTFH